MTVVDQQVVLPPEGRVSVPGSPLIRVLAWANQTDLASRPADVRAALAEIHAGTRALSRTIAAARLRDVIADALRVAEPGDYVPQVYRALDDAGAILTPQRLVEIRAVVLRDAARLADRVANQQPGRCACPSGGQRECGWRDGAGSVAAQLRARVEEPAPAAAPRSWVVPGEPGRDVIAVRDVATKALYVRLRGGGWMRENEEGEPVDAPVAWAWLVRAAAGGLVDATDEGE
ncbi:hypothetical protein OOJ91_34055 [Micromonospora lupini]|uniref:hypothetical protein n=1 Tax=Micromonospora lupini TaxID=285679 RepID=UPI0022554E94|nr:hypothetical protein [Micromonospora lupini]MCX5070873.1 hypothetical protein [Micromonospora lupini]